ncbi:macrophage mannose receptor 1-like [Physella acuta]|uniref:macrophage mannose receptor 1-like n=1 Tax=Physella acuta TaxID=109671 RepID=UPI0027DD3A71|nr:macrophage mannose receptor 1-like [Physella acuta]
MATERVLKFIYILCLTMYVYCFSKTDENDPWFEYEGARYYFSDGLEPYVNWNGAIEKCSSYGANMVAYGDKIEMGMLYSQISETTWVKRSSGNPGYCYVFLHSEGSGEEDGVYHFDAIGDNRRFFIGFRSCDDKLPFICKKGNFTGFKKEVVKTFDRLDHRTYQCDVTNLFYRGQCLVTVETPLPFDEANQMCSSNGGSLMEIINDVDYTLLDYELQARNVTGDVWVGLSNRVIRNETTKKEDIKKYAFPWFKNCNVYSGGRLHSKPCQSRQPFVCRLPVEEMYNSTNQTVPFRHHHHTHHHCPGLQIRYLDHCYKIHSEHYYSWHHAKDYCKKHKMGLMIIHSYEEFQFVRTHLGNISNIWVGMYTTKTGQLESLDHNTWNLTAESADSNDNHTRECVAFNHVSAMLQFKSCKVKMNFVCTGKHKDRHHDEKYHEKTHMFVAAIVGGVLAAVVVVGLLVVIGYKRRNTLLAGRLYIHSRFRNHSVDE